MREIIVSKNEEGKKLFAILCAHLTNAPGSILHKSIRNKNITLNSAKTKEDAKVKAGDKIQVFFSDETFEKFCGNADKEEYVIAIKNISSQIDVLYEDDDILAVNKEAGVLSQKASENDVSINEMIISYLLKSGKISEETLKNFRPAAVNRLDRNTSGIVLFGKTMEGLQQLSEGLRDRTIHKYYKAIVVGNLKKTGECIAYLHKDEASNKVIVKDREFKDSVEIKTKILNSEYIADKDISQVTIELLTGKTHQIRAFLSHIGNPIVGDLKYGISKVNNSLKVKRQLLHSYKVEIPYKDIVIEAKMPDDFKKLLKNNNK